jgi:O-acetyl-ADP-ribose deacetylase (regulator of RNase III)
MSKSLDDIIQGLKNRNLKEEAEILERNEDFILKKLGKQSEDLKEALGEGEEQQIQEAIRKLKEKLLIERIKESVEYFSNLKESITKNKEFTGLLSKVFQGSLQNKIEDIQKIEIGIEKEQIDSLEQLLDFLAEKFYEETTVTENKREKKISNIDKIKFEDFSKFLKENSVFSLIQVYESLLILARGQEIIIKTEKGKSPLAPYTTVLKKHVLKEEPFDERSFDIVVKRVEDKYQDKKKEINGKNILPSEVSKYLSIFPLLYILDLDSIQKITKTFENGLVETIKGHIKLAYEALLEGLENIKKEIDEGAKNLDQNLKQKIDDMDTEKQTILQELQKLGISIVQKNPKANDLVKDLTGELKRIKNISFFRNYFFFRDLIDVLKVHHQKNELGSMIEKQKKVEDQINVQKAKLRIEEKNFSLRAFNVFRPGHYITFGLDTKKGNNLVTVKFDNTGGFITKKTLTNFTKVHIDSDFFKNQSIVTPEDFLFSTVVYQEKSDKKPEIRIKETVKTGEILKENFNKEIEIKYIDQISSLLQVHDVEIYFIVVRLYAIYEKNKGNAEIRVFLSFILQLILLKTILDRRVFMMVNHMKGLKEIIQRSKLKQITINNPKSYSINKKIQELVKQDIETNNIEYLFKIDTFLELKQNATQEQYGNLEGLLPEGSVTTLNKIKKFYKSLVSSSQDYNSSLEKSLDILSKIAIVMDEFSWRVKNSEIKNEDDFLRIVLNYYQMLRLLNEINQISEIFKLFEEGVDKKEQKLKNLFNSLSSMAMKICETALECQPFNLYTLRTTLGFFYKISFEKDYEAPKTQGGDKTELNYEMIVNNLNFSHYRQVSECLGIPKEEVIKYLESKTNAQIKDATLEIIDNMSLELCKNQQLARSFYDNISNILEKSQDETNKPQSLIIPVVDQKGNKILNQKVGTSVLRANRRTLGSPKNKTNVKDLEKVLPNITKKSHEKLLQITFTNKRSFSVVQGKIEEVNYAQAVVNAANGMLGGGGGITGAIFDKAGISGNLENYLKNNIIPDGFAVISDGFNLRKEKGVNFIIHAVGPDLKEKKQIKEAISSLKFISHAVKNAISIGVLIDEDPNQGEIDQQAINDMKTIVIPLISGGIFSGDLRSKGYKFIIMSNLAAIFHVLINTKETENFPNEVILIELDEQKVNEILSCVVTLCKAVGDEILEIRY